MTGQNVDKNVQIGDRKCAVRMGNVANLEQKGCEKAQKWCEKAQKWSKKEQKGCKRGALGDQSVT